MLKIIYFASAFVTIKQLILKVKEEDNFESAQNSTPII